MLSQLSRVTISQSLRHILSKVPPASFAADKTPKGGCGYSSNRRYLSTYYDSQSGLHLPVHDDSEIRLFLDVRTNSEPYVPHRLSKDRLEADEVTEALQGLVQKGIHGLILPQIRFPRDVRNLHTLSVIAPSGFCVLTDTSETTSDSDMIDEGLLQAKEASSTATNFSKILEYRNNDEEGCRVTLQQSTDKGLHTTLSVGEEIYAGEGGDGEPITLANNIAAMIDASGGCDYIWISANKEENKTATVADIMAQVCEELMYLDVAGATIKSRLLVDALKEDMVEDIMFAGVNKYVIDNEDQAELVDTVAKEQGKTLLRL